MTTQPPEQPDPGLSGFVHRPLQLLAMVATAAYPLLVYLGFGRWDPLWLALGLAALMLLRAASARCCSARRRRSPAAGFR